MTLDLDELTRGWECPPGELRARIIPGRDGQELVQLRVDLGVMQMEPVGRPDGERYHALPSARDYIEHELRIGGKGITEEDWEELERELMQVNYRRMAYSAAAEEALREDDDERAGRFIRGALSDIDTCLTNLDLLHRHSSDRGGYPSLRPTLTFDQARLSTQLGIVEGRFEEAIELADAGADSLRELLSELGYDEEQQAEDPGLRYLRSLGRKLRSEYGISQTLAERLTQAIEDEDFETAADIQRELEQRRRELSPADRATDTEAESGQDN